MNDFHEYQIMDILKNHIKNKKQAKNINIAKEYSTITTSTQQKEEELSK